MTARVRGSVRVAAAHVRANAVAYLALFVALGGTGAYAADKIGSSDIAKDAVKSKHVKDHSLQGKDFADGQLPAGPRGPQGPKGDPGTPGAPGSPGSPDTAQQVRDKLLTVDGSSSQIDADLLDGTDSSGFLGASDTAADADKLDGVDSTGYVRELFSDTYTVDLPALAQDICTNGAPLYTDGLTGTENLVVTPSGGWANGLTLNSNIAPVGGGVWELRFWICNRGSTTVDLGQIGLNFRVFR